MANTLERYLNDIYEKEVCIEHVHEEKEFITSSVEESINQITDLIRNRQLGEIQKAIDGFCAKYPGLKPTEDPPLRDGQLLKVGSSYDGTKNCMLDQFDFVFVIGTLVAVDCSTSVKISATDNLSNIIREISKMIRQLSSDCLKLIFNSEFGEIAFKYVTVRGPVLTFEFKHTITQGYRRERYINVDFVPAFKIIDAEIRSVAKQICFCQGFCDEIKATGSFLVVEDIVFTETECHFVKHVLSDRHRKVFRLVKYLINNLDFHTGLSSRIDQPELTFISSYMIKSIVIYHHYECQTSAEGIGECVLDIMRCFVNIAQTLETRLLTPQLASKWSYHLSYDDPVHPFYLKSLVKSLEKLRKSRKPYIYKKPRSYAESLWQYSDGMLSCKEWLTLGCSCVCLCT